MGRKYRGRDLDKFISEKMEELRAKGVDAQDFCSVHPGGSQEAMNEMFKDLSYTREQSLAWKEHNKSNLKEQSKQNSETVERREELRKLGEY